MLHPLPRYIFRMIIGGAVALTLLGSSVAFAQATPIHTRDARAIDALLAPYFNRDEPGATVIVTQGGKLILHKAYGLANLDANAEMTAEMVLRLGSISKQYTAVGIMILVDQGKLTIYDEITKYLPDYPTQGKKITIENLLTHTSGIKGYTSMPAFRSIMHTDMTVAARIDFFKNEPFEFEPGTHYTYRNSGYFLLGAIIEKVSGKPYADFVAQQIFEPLGMKDTAYEWRERNGHKRIEGYTRGNENHIKKAAAISMTQPYSAGALVSTVDDLARWDAAITAGKPLKPATWTKMFTLYRLPNGDSTGYGYGWQIRTMQNHLAIEHDGGIPGFASGAMRLPDYRTSKKSCCTSGGR